MSGAVVFLATICNREREREPYLSSSPSFFLLPLSHITRSEFVRFPCCLPFARIPKEARSGERGDSFERRERVLSGLPGTVNQIFASVHSICFLTRTTLKIGDTTPALTETLANFNACVNEGGTGRKEGKSGASGPKVWCDAAARRGWRRRRLCFLLQ